MLMLILAQDSVSVVNGLEVTVGGKGRWGSVKRDF